MSEITPLQTALAHLEAGDWEAAHPILQDDATKLGAWGHGIVHILEGDYGNARYWYGRSGRPYPEPDAVQSEIAALRKAVS
jgi:hypothetical protein